jgi:hypothetical protein
MLTRDCQYSCGIGRADIQQQIWDSWRLTDNDPLAAQPTPLWSAKLFTGCQTDLATTAL